MNYIEYWEKERKAISDTSKVTFFGNAIEQPSIASNRKGTYYYDTEGSLINFVE